MNPIIKSNLDFLEREMEKTASKLKSFKGKAIKKTIKDASSILQKASDIKKENINVSVVGNIEKRTRPLQEIKKSKPVVWL